VKSPDDKSLLLSLEDLSIGYAASHPIVTGINLQVEAGEMIALIGRNGSGKSTLIRSVAGIIPSLSGNCYLEGEKVRSIELRVRARKISFVASQVAQPPQITVKELVSLGRMPHTGWRGRLGAKDREMVEKAIGAVSMQGLSDRTLDHLSDGERQRAMIARAFVQDTPLMVLDEPTAFLDLPNRYELIQLLTEFREAGKAILYSTHDLESAMMFSDRMWVIDQGSMEEGVPEDLGIKGVFDTLFASTGITFDVAQRKFRPSGRLRGILHLTGDDAVTLAWTRNALERLGYQLKEDADRRLKVDSSGTVPAWILTWSEGSARFKNIETLARFLIQEN
jgi:iron complex transport system ATP-binding protein